MTDGKATRIVHMHASFTAQYTYIYIYIYSRLVVVNSLKFLKRDSFRFAMRKGTLSTCIDKGIWNKHTLKGRKDGGSVTRVIINCLLMVSIENFRSMGGGGVPQTRRSINVKTICILANGQWMI